MKSIILYEDKDIIVCHKLAGIAVQTKKIGQMDMVSELNNYRKGKPVYVVHRLDQPVEGLLVFAKNKEAAKSLTNQVGLSADEDRMLKIYEAKVFGCMKEKTGKLSDFMMMETGTNQSRIVSKEEAEAIAKEKNLASRCKPKEARLEYEVIEELQMESQKEGMPEGMHGGMHEGMHEEMHEGMHEGMQEGMHEGIQILRIHLLTGRHHQIRLQMANAGCPLLGDQKYGSEASIQYSKENGIKNVALKAVHLEFVHPGNGEKMVFDLDHVESEK